MNLLKVLIVGQTPPPYGGQATSIERLVNGSFLNMKIFHVRMAFSREMDEIGKFSIRKLLHLIQIILKIWWVWIRHRPTLLYYPPAGPQTIPMFRDFAILLATRWLFRRIVFGFHASGISEIYPNLGFMTRFIYRLAYYNADAAIVLSSLNPPDGMMLKAKRSFIVPNGIEDCYPAMNFINQAKQKPPIILFVGVLRESKGIMVLLDACRQLSETGNIYRLDLVGKIESPKFCQQMTTFIEKNHLKQQVKLCGVMTGADKWRRYSFSEIFCYPTFFENESFGNVLLEAMQFEMPIVASRWRGVASIVEDGQSGYLVLPKDSRAIYEKLELLLNNTTMRREMGKRGRRIYLEKYTIGRYRNDMENIFLSLRCDSSSESRIAK
jgi:glycosyltransferase involved in cell wall biosynthesis